MELCILLLVVVTVLGFLFNRLNAKDPEAENNTRAYDESIASMNESAKTSAEQIYKQSQDSSEHEKEQNQPDTLGLMVKTLRNLGCQPTSNEDGTISVQYQGENFYMEFGGMYARVWDPMWAHIKADDPDMPKVREAVNASNFNFGPTVVMTDANENGEIGFHSRYDIMLHPVCPDNDQYVKAVLDTFFDAKEQVRNQFQQINAKQMAAAKKRRPVGFATSRQ